MDAQLGLFDDQPLAGEFPLPDDARQSVCRSCGASVAWIRTEAGKAMPLSLKTARTIGGVRYALTHFADCPQGKDWSHRR